MSANHPFQRPDGRQPDQPRPIKLTTGFTMHAEGSVLVETGATKVICTTSVEEGVPPFLKGKNQGWLTAEYGMLPRSTSTRKRRDSSTGKVDGRTTEIQRLIGRALRSVVDLHSLGERTLWIDCDVIQADGGTRTASITGAFVSTVLALRTLNEKQGLQLNPVQQHLASISVGIKDGTVLCDLNYLEDRDADVDMNIVMREDGLLVEVQGTAEHHPFSRDQMNAMLDSASAGLKEHFNAQKEALQNRLAL